MRSRFAGFGRLALLAGTCTLCVLLWGCIPIGTADPGYYQVYERVPLDDERIELRLVKRGTKLGKERLDEVHLRLGDDIWYITLAYVGKPLLGTPEPGQYYVKRAVGPRIWADKYVKPVVVEHSCGLGRCFYFERPTKDTQADADRLVAP